MTEAERIQGKNAAAVITDKFINIDTYSGHRLLGVDVRGAHILLSPTASTETIGNAVLEALNKSRFLSLEESDRFFDDKTEGEEYQRGIEAMIKDFGYRSRMAMFKNMMRVSIRLTEDVMSFMPSIHTGLERWRSSKSDGLEDVVIPADSDPSTIGKALLEAFKRCR
jgi:hypothetical protein